MSIEHTFNTTCDVQVLTKTYKAKSGQPVRTYANLYTGERCRLDMAGSGEKRTADDIYNIATHILYIRFIDGLSPLQHQIVHKSNDYNILRVSKAGGIEHHLEILLELIK